MVHWAHQQTAVAVLAENGRLVAFWRGTDNALWHRWQEQDFSWSGPMSLGDRLAGDPAAVLAENGRLVAFLRGTDNALWHCWQEPNFSWAPAVRLGGELAGEPQGLRALVEAAALALRYRETVVLSSPPPAVQRAALSTCSDSLGAHMRRSRNTAANP